MGINLSSEDEIARDHVTNTHRNVYFLRAKGESLRSRIVIPEARAARGICEPLSLLGEKEDRDPRDSCTEWAKFVFFALSVGMRKAYVLSSKTQA
jgi:hypothetical protein